MLLQGKDMIRDYELTNYDYYSNRRDMEIVSSIVDALNKILEEDKKQEQPLFLKISDNLVMDIARKVASLPGRRCCLCQLP